MAPVISWLNIKNKPLFFSIEEPETSFSVKCLFPWDWRTLSQKLPPTTTPAGFHSQLIGQNYIMWSFLSQSLARVFEWEDFMPKRLTEELGWDWLPLRQLIEWEGMDIWTKLGFYEKGSRGRGGKEIRSAQLTGSSIRGLQKGAPSNVLKLGCIKDVQETT